MRIGLQRSIGYWLILLYCFATAFSSVFVNRLDVKGNPFVIAFFTFLFAAIVFNGQNARKLNLFYHDVFSHWRLFLIINILSAAIWLNIFWALQFVSPAILLCVYMSMLPIATLLLTIPLKDIAAHKQELLLCVAMIVVMGGLILNKLYFVSIINARHLFGGVIIGLIAGVSGAAYNVYSQKLHRLQFTASQVLAVRFYFLLLISLFIGLFVGFLPTLQHIYWWQFLLLAVVTSILPLFVKQQALIYIGARKISFVMPFTPVLAYGLELLTGAYHFHLLILIFIVAISVLLFLLSTRRPK